MPSGLAHRVSRVLPNDVCSSLANNERPRSPPNGSKRIQNGFYTALYCTSPTTTTLSSALTGSTASPTPSARSSAHVSFPLSYSRPRCQLFWRSPFLVQAFFRTCVSSPTLDTEHTWHEVARFSSPQNLSCVFSWVIAPILYVSVCSSCPYSNLSGRLLSMSFLSSHAS